MATLYELLGVRDDASDDEIKRAYRRAAMKAHPDRNMGREASAHAQFQEIKEAYAILSDPVQRRVYDAVYAEEMARLARQHEEEEARMQAAREAEYAQHVATALRFAEQGHNRDVVFGVLLGCDCESEMARRIADGAVELHMSRQERTSQNKGSDEPATRDVMEPDTGTAQQTVPEHAQNGDPLKGEERTHAKFFSTLWHGMFGLHS
ncbi:MAG TPA: J domain-containing protein [Paraburkholderia sp.]|uniref:J domain-containing protein n=1 Tax=Paraburkholderia sp. TaxID=1926495 RepID=UPI002B9C84DB|nr:J domain-containing protein [Paraburkholderia sp.]HTR05139.1 J domain-containing protein [Paraburkholderia sp.]